jgi:hypothetical protein
LSFVPNLGAALVDASRKIIPPWNSFFQQFTQNAEAASIPVSPFTPNTQGSLIFTTGTPTITLTRGILVLTLTGQKIIPIAVGDTVTWSGATTVHFLRTFSK